MNPGLVLANLNFPGTLNFVSELYLFSGLLGVGLLVGVVFVLPTFASNYFWLLVFNRKNVFNSGGVLLSLDLALIIMANVIVVFASGIWCLC